MLKRIKKIINGEIIEPMLLTSRLLQRSGIGEAIPEKIDTITAEEIGKNSKQEKENANVSFSLIYSIAWHAS
jgi:hypothetical protein